MTGNYSFIHLINQHFLVSLRQVFSFRVSNYYLADARWPHWIFYMVQRSLQCSGCRFRALSEHLRSKSAIADPPEKGNVTSFLKKSNKTIAIWRAA